MQVERLIKALANKRRLAIVKFLHRNSEASVADIADHLKLSLKATSKHLQILFAADILERRQQSLNIFYRLSKPIHAILRTVVPYL